MTVRLEPLALIVALLLVSVSASATVLTGRVVTKGAQPILAPKSLTSPVTLSFYVPDGTHVKKGEPILRINASAAASQIDSLESQIAVARATNAATLATKQLAVYDARIALVNAVAARETAKVNAVIPKNLITGIDYDTYQGTYKSDERDAVLAQQKLAAAQAAVTRQRKSGALSLKKLEDTLAFDKAQVAVATVHAQRDGTVLHAFKTGFIVFGGGGGSDQNSARYRQGSMVFPGTRVGEVVGSGGRQYSVQAWALQPDRQGLKVGQAVRVHFDALPMADVSGHITAISDAAQTKQAWGDGHYYSIDVALDAAVAKLPLQPGMSARVQTTPVDDHKPVSAGTTHPGVLHATGEVVAQNTWRLVPPHLPGVWQMNIISMAPDGAVAHKGQPLVTFAAGSLQLQLPNTLSQLAEAERARDQLRLQLADDERTVVVAVAKAKGDAIQAKRKANQPKEYIPGVQYKQLVIARAQMQQIYELTKLRSAVAAASRKAQMEEDDAKVAQLQRKVKRMQHSLASLTIRAPRTGLFLHTVESDGTKIDVGSTIFFGQTIGSMPDMHTLAVRASLPERDLRKVKVGQAVRVILSGGGGRTFDGHIARIGRNVHSKSDAEPEPVVDLTVAFQGDPSRLRPGRSVSVDILPAGGNAS